MYSFMAGRHDTPAGVSNKERHTVVHEVEYLMENTVLVNIGDNRKVRAGSVITDVEIHCGLRSILAIVPRASDCYEITFNNKDTADLFLDGVSIQGQIRDSRPVHQDTVMVSIMFLSSFITDEMIRKRFSAMEIDIVSQIKRHLMIADDGHKIPDGTRFFRCKFPPHIKSLPYLIKFDTPAGSGTYKVLHNEQRKVCHKCWSTDHLLRNCPYVLCNQCKEAGHIARDCSAERCCDCGEYPNNCECQYYDDEEENVEKIDDQEADDYDEDSNFMERFLNPTRE